MRPPKPVKSKILCAQDVSSTKNPIWLGSSSLAREIFPFHSAPNYFLLAVRSARKRIAIVTNVRRVPIQMGPLAIFTE
jgi:hypothetical protein